MRGVQLSKYTPDSSCVHVDELSPDQHCAFVNNVILVKCHVSPSVLKQIKSSEAPPMVYYDSVDSLCFPDEIEAFQKRMTYYDVVIVTTHRARVHVYNLGYTGMVTRLEHHWDPRIVPRLPRFPLRFGYMGSALSYRSNLSFARALKDTHDLRMMDTESGLDVSAHFLNDARLNKIIRATSTNLDGIDPPFDCHLSLRDPQSAEYSFKTNAKVSTAAAFGQPIVTTAEDAAVEVLGGDYPLYVEHNLQHVQNKLNYVKCHPDRIADALTMLESLRARTSVEHIAEKYARMRELLRRVGIFIQRLSAALRETLADSTNHRVVYRGVFGGNVEGMHIPQEAPEEGIDYVCITDVYRRDLPEHYRVVYVDAMVTNFATRRRGASGGGTLSNRILKMLVPELLPDQYSRSLYIDYSFQPPRSHSELLDAPSVETPLVAYEHDMRNTTREEFHELNLLKLITEDESKFYCGVYNRLVPGCMDDTLTWNNTIARLRTSELMVAMRTWLHVFLEDVPRDQSSLQFVLAMCNVKANILPQTGDKYGVYQ